MEGNSRPQLCPQVGHGLLKRNMIVEVFQGRIKLCINSKTYYISSYGTVRLNCRRYGSGMTEPVHVSYLDVENLRKNIKSKDHVRMLAPRCFLALIDEMLPPLHISLASRELSQGF